MKIFKSEMVHTLALKETIQAKIGERLMGIMSEKNLNIAMIADLNDPNREVVDQLIYFNKVIAGKCNGIIGFLEKLEKLLGDE